MERDKKGRRKACRKRKSKKAFPASENSLEKSPENANSFGIDNDDDQFPIENSENQFVVVNLDDDDEDDMDIDSETGNETIIVFS